MNTEPQHRNPFLSDEFKQFAHRIIDEYVAELNGLCKTPSAEVAAQVNDEQRLRSALLTKILDEWNTDNTASH